jgi:hypothetical protein
MPQGANGCAMALSDAAEHLRKKATKHMVMLSEMFPSLKKRFSF